MSSHVATEVTSATEFIAQLTAFTHHNGRTLKARKSPGSKLMFVNLINLPPGVGGAGGGAEAENNRAMFTIAGWDPEDPDAPAPTGKVKVDTSVNVFHRTHKLRAKTGSPAAICKYLADFINKVAKEVPPNFTHTKMAKAIARRFIERRPGR
jgi:hypothetical protein